MGAMSLGFGSLECYLYLHLVRNDESGTKLCTDLICTYRVKVT